MVGLIDQYQPVPNRMNLFHQPIKATPSVEKNLGWGRKAMGHSRQRSTDRYDCQATEGGVRVCLWHNNYEGRFFSYRLESSSYPYKQTIDYLLLQPKQSESMLCKSDPKPLMQGRFQ
jgi:hypothetical protein